LLIFKLSPVSVRFTAFYGNAIIIRCIARMTGGGEFTEIEVVI